MNNETRKGKFNVIDALIILLVAACIIGVVYRAVDGSATVNAYNEYTLNIEIEDIRGSSLNYFVENDSVRLASTNEYIGIFNSISSDFPAIGAYNENGEYLFYPELEGDTIYNEERRMATGHITVRGTLTEGGFLLNGTHYITLNSELDIVTEHVMARVKIIGINEK